MKKVRKYSTLECIRHYTKDTIARRAEINDEAVLAGAVRCEYLLKVIDKRNKTIKKLKKAGK